MRPFLLAALAVLPVGPAAAQPLPPNVVFDDFAYTSTEWAETTLTDADGAWREGPPPPSGSVYGVSPWTTPEAEVDARLWYRYSWHEPSHLGHFGTLEPSDAGLDFTLVPGVYAPEGCPDLEDPTRSMFPQQIATGFAARRGTWAARVRLGEMRHPRDVGTIQAFWLVSPVSARVRSASGVDQKVWNEVDHEYNNRFLGDDQLWDYDATGFRGGGGTDPDPRNMFAPPLAGAAPGNPIRPPEGLAWTCTSIRDGRGERLSAAACAEAITNPHGRSREVWTTLYMRVADEGISFALHADLGDRQLVMSSDVSGPTTVLPQYAVFSQHLTPGPAGTCADRTDLRFPVRTGVDWFYYTPDPTATIGRVLDDVDALRAAGISRAMTVPGLDLERPVRHLPATVRRDGFGQRTTGLDLTLEAPREMRPGETSMLVALPPLRHGSYRFTWTTSTRQTDGPLVTERRPPASFALPFTFPEDADHVIVRVRLEELDPEGRVVRDGPVHPIERRVTIRRVR